MDTYPFVSEKIGNRGRIAVLYSLSVLLRFVSRERSRARHF